MRDFGVVFGTWLNARHKEPRFVCQISFEDDNSDDVFILSHDDITVTDPGATLTARTKGFSVVSQRLYPDEGRSSIGGFSFEALDLSDSLTQKQRTALTTDGNGLRWKRARFHVGFAGMAWADYELYATQIVQKITYNQGVVTIACNDVQRAARIKVLEPVVLALAQPISATDTTIPISGDTSQIELLEHDAGFTDAPSLTVAYIKIDDEIIRIPSGGISAGQFTGVTRGALGTRAAAHSTDESGIAEKQKKVEELIYLEMNAVKLAYAVLTGNLLGQSATMPTRWHAGIAASFIDLPSFQNIGSDLYDGTATGGGETLRFVAPKGGDAKAFVEKEICRILGLYLFVKADGQLALRRLENVTHGAAPIDVIRDRDIVGKFGLEYLFDRIHNHLEVEWNVVDDELSRITSIQDAASQGRWKKSDVFRIKASGLHGSLHSRDTLTRLFERFRDRYTGPPITTRPTLLMRMAALEVGDIVRVISDQANDFTDPQGTAGGGLDRSFEVQETELDWLRGTFRVRLFGSTQNAGPLTRDEDGEAIPDAWFSSAGTDIEGGGFTTSRVGSVVTLDANGSFTGGTNNTAAGSILYCTGDLVIPAGVTLTISQNVQLRIQGTLTINGAINGVGNGLAGVADTLDASSWPVFSDPEPAQEPWAGVQAQLGQVGYYGSPRAGGGLFERASGRSGSSSRFRISSQSFAAPATEGVVDIVPAYLIGWNGTLVTGLPTDLRGSSGGPGGKRHWSDVEPSPDSIDSNAGGTGGNGGAGLLVVARGAAFGAAGQVNLSGGNGSVGSYNAGDDRPAHAGAGAGGAPGAVIFVVDGVLNPLPILTNATIPATYGETPLPAGNYNVMSDAFFFDADTRIGLAQDALLPPDRYSFYQNGTTSGYFAGVAAARALYLAPAAAVSEDGDDINLADQQSVALAVVQAYDDVFDDGLTRMTATVTPGVVTAAYSHCNIYVRGFSAGAQYPEWVFLGSADSSLSFDMPADGETYEFWAQPVLVNGALARTGNIVTLATTAGVDGTGPWSRVTGAGVPEDYAGANRPDFGGIVFNSAMEIQDRERDRPAGWYVQDGTAGRLGYFDSAKTQLSLDSDTDPSVTATSAVFPVNPGTSYELNVRARHRGAANRTTYFRVFEYDSALPDGVLSLGRVVGVSAPPYDAARLVAATRERAIGHEAVELPTTFADYPLTYTPTATARWACVALLNWDATEGELVVDRATITELSTRNTGALADLDLINTAQVTVGAVTAFARAAQSSVVVGSTFTQVGSMTVDCGSDPANTVALVTFHPAAGLYRSSATTTGWFSSVNWRLLANGTQVDVELQAFYSPSVWTASETRAQNPSPMSFLVPGSLLVSGNNTFVFQVSGNGADLISYTTGNSSYMTVQIFKRT